MDENNNQTNNINNQELNNLANQNISENNIKQSTYNTTINETSSAHNPNTYNTQINGQQTASMNNNQNIGANPQKNLYTNYYQMSGMNGQQVQSTPNQQANSINPNINQNTYNTQNIGTTQQTQNNNSQYNNINTNDKKAEFGTSQDGKIIASARKIKGEIIGGYFVVGIPLGILLAIVSLILISPTIYQSTISSMGGLQTSFEEISKKLLILNIPMSIAGVIISLLIVFLSSKITFRKRKVRKCDVPNVFKTLTIVLLIFGAISLFSSVSSYLRDVGNLDQQIKQMEKLNNRISMYSSTQSLDSKYGEMLQGSTEAINKMKSDYLIICIVGVVCNIASTGLEILLQKKMLEKNAEG